MQVQHVLEHLKALVAADKGSRVGLGNSLEGLSDAQGVASVLEVVALTLERRAGNPDTALPGAVDASVLLAGVVASGVTSAAHHLDVRVGPASVDEQGHKGAGAHGTVQLNVSLDVHVARLLTELKLPGSIALTRVLGEQVADAVEVNVSLRGVNEVHGKAEEASGRHRGT